MKSGELVPMPTGVHGKSRFLSCLPVANMPTVCPSEQWKLSWISPIRHYATTITNGIAPTNKVLSLSVTSMPTKWKLRSKNCSVKSKCPKTRQNVSTTPYPITKSPSLHSTKTKKSHTPGWISIWNTTPCPAKWEELSTGPSMTIWDKLSVSCLTTASPKSLKNRMLPSLPERFSTEISSFPKPKMHLLLSLWVKTMERSMP